MEYSSEYLRQSFFFRGFVISTFADLEKHVETFIMRDLNIMEQCGYEMQTVILDRMTFEAKRQSFKSLLEDKFRRAGFVKTNKKGYPCKELLFELTMLNDIRNQFAHYPLRTAFRRNDDGNHYVISLSRYRDEFSSVDFTEADIQKIIDRMLAAGNKIVEFSGDLKTILDLPF